MFYSEMEEKLLKISNSSLAREIKNLPSSKGLQNAYQQNEISIEKIASSFIQVSHYFQEYSALTTKSLLFDYQINKEFDKELEFPTEVLSRRDYFSHLALTIVGHDLIGKNGGLGGYGFLLDAMIKRNQIKEAQEKLKENAFIFYEFVRLGLQMIPYVAFGNKDDLTSIPISSFEKIIKDELNNQSTEMQLSTKADQIQIDEAWIIYQAIKNSKNQLYDLTNPKINVFINNGEDTQLTINDNGHGIEKEVLPKIFGHYTNKGTGFGLQIVKRLVDLREGEITVTSTTKERQTYQYNTKSQKVEKLRPKQGLGTTIEVHLNNFF